MKEGKVKYYLNRMHLFVDLTTWLDPRWPFWPEEEEEEYEEVEVEDEDEEWDEEKEDATMAKDKTWRITRSSLSNLITRSIAGRRREVNAIQFKWMLVNLEKDVLVMLNLLNLHATPDSGWNGEIAGPKMQERGRGSGETRVTIDQPVEQDKCNTRQKCQTDYSLVTAASTVATVSGPSNWDRKRQYTTHWAWRGHTCSWSNAVGTLITFTRVLSFFHETRGRHLFKDRLSLSRRVSLLTAEPKVPLQMERPSSMSKWLRRWLNLPSLIEHASF